MTKRERLIQIIERFLKKEINGDTFEQEYSTIYDLDETDFFEEENGYFSKIREILTHFTPFEEDIRLSKYYIDDKELFRQVNELQQE
jgi:hypothetical protein